MGVSFVLIFIVLFYAFIIIGSIALLIWTISKRIKEKKHEDKEHKDYKKY